MPTPSHLPTIAELSASLTQISVPDKPAYKRSQFTAHAMNTDGTTVVYNSLTGKHCVVPAMYRDHLQHYLSKASHVGDLDPLGDYLFSRGYIVAKSRDERSLWDLRYGTVQYRTNHLEVMLLASEDCNFRCTYCSQQFKRDSMQPFVRTAVLNLLKAKMHSLTSLDINWFGGEPLVGFDAINEMAPIIQSLAREHQTILGGSITTNAFLLTPDIARKLLSWDIRTYQITLDGTAEDHDSHRPLKDGGETFNTILANLLAMKSMDEPFQVFLRVNADRENSPRLQPLFDLLSSSFGNDSRFRMRFKAVGQWGGAGDSSLNVFCGKNEERETLVKLKLDAKRTGLAVESTEEDLKPDQVCYAARPYAFIVGADGKLMKCSVVLDTMPANVVGQVGTDGLLHFNDDMFAQWVKPFYRSDEACQKCFFLPSCQGAHCPLPRFVGDRPCPTVKLQIQQTLQDLYKYETSPLGVS